VGEVRLIGVPQEKHVACAGVAQLASRQAEGNGTLDANQKRTTEQPGVRALLAVADASSLQYAVHAACVCMKSRRRASGAPGSLSWFGGGPWLLESLLKSM
jgi:hypothetical protein